MNLHGILPPLTTPFDSQGALDLAALERNLETYNATGLAGYVAFGSNGEAPHLSAEERARVLECLARNKSPDKTLVAGVNALSTREAIDATAQAADCGAEVALVITPYFYKGSMSGEVLQHFFLEVAEASALPILLYNVPQNTGVVLPPKSVAEVAAHPRIVGIKDSSGNLAVLAETIDRTPDDFQVLVGNAGILYSALTVGAVGAVLAVACLVPETCVALHRAVRAGRHEEARTLQFRQAPVARMVTAEFGVPGLKASLDLASEMGLPFIGGDPRSPLRPLQDPQRERLRAGMVESGLFPGL